MSEIAVFIRNLDFYTIVLAHSNEVFVAFISINSLDNFQSELKRIQELKKETLSTFFYVGNFSSVIIYEK